MSFPQAADWRRTHHGTDLEVTSPCGRLTLLHQQEHTGSGPHLLVTARTGPDAPERWRITLRGHVPIEFVTALTGAITTSLREDPDALVYGVGPGHAAPVAVDPQWFPFSQAGLGGFVSRDGHAAIVGRPQGSGAPAPDGDDTVAWKIGAAPDITGEVWSATFTYGAPSHLVAACVNEVSSPEPVIRPVTSSLDPRLAPLLRYAAVQAVRPPRPTRYRRPGDSPDPRAPRHGR